MLFAARIAIIHPYISIARSLYDRGSLWRCVVLI
jgi:hypothetical protein